MNMKRMKREAAKTKTMKCKSIKPVTLMTQSSAKRASAKKQATPIEKVKQFIKDKMKKKTDKKAPDEEVPQLEEDASARSKSSGKSGEASIPFFYTNDKFMSQFEDDEIVSEIQKKYPKFLGAQANDADLKKTLCQMLQDKEFIDDLLKTYDMTMLDFFRLFFRKDIGIFRGSFVTKVSNIIDSLGYDIGLRK